MIIPEVEEDEERGIECGMGILVTEEESGEGAETVDDVTPAFKDEVRLDEEGTCTKGDCNATFEGVCCSR